MLEFDGKNQVMNIRWVLTSKMMPIHQLSKHLKNLSEYELEFPLSL